jgi:hypothetical protein
MLVAHQVAGSLLHLHLLFRHSLALVLQNKDGLVRSLQYVRVAFGLALCTFRDDCASLGLGLTAFVASSIGYGAGSHNVVARQNSTLFPHFKSQLPSTSTWYFMTELFHLNLSMACTMYFTIQRVLRGPHLAV